MNYEIDENKKNIKILNVDNITPKKISGTSLAGVLGCDDWKTPFQIWCDIMKIYKKPFVENKFVTAGKVIEPKQAKYIKDKYNLVGLTSPSDKYGDNYFFKTRGDFFPLDNHFQGMWDYINLNLETGNISSVIECKTAQEKNRENWEKSIPFNYLLQAGLYAYLLKVDKVVVPVTFLKPEDYDNPQALVLDENNTKIYPFKMSEHLPRFEEEYVRPAIIWWNNYVVTGISPSFDEYNTGDAEIIRELKNDIEKENSTKPTSNSVKLKDIKCDDVFY